MIFDLPHPEPLSFGLLGGAMLCFMVYWITWAQRDVVSLAGAWVKAGATGLMVVLLLGPMIYARQMPTPDPLLLMPVGLLFGTVGDFALARRGVRAFLTGMAAFAIGHLIYAVGLWTRTQQIVAVEPAIGAGGLSQTQLIALAGLALLLLSTEFWLAPKTGALRWPVRCYGVIIGAMAAVVIMLVDTTGSGVLRLGAALFVLSDVLLALRLFVVRGVRTQRALSLTLWPVYWLGQMLLVVGGMGYGMFPKG